MDQRDVRREQGVALRGDFAKLAADGDEAVGCLDQVVGDPGITAEQPYAQRIGARYAAFATKRMRNRNILVLREARQRIPALGQMYAPADQQHRTPRLGDE